jgi:hypothetical protein
MDTIVTSALAIACVLVLAETAVFFRNLTGLRSLSGSSAPEPDTWPSVSVVMAARNEADAVAEAVASRLADDYPALELIFVDDRSTDGTGELAQAAAGADRRFTYARVNELPDGWLGKVHALHLGAAASTGEWLLFSDGDVVVRLGAVRKAVAHCLAEEVDLLAVVPAFDTGSFLVDAVWAVFMRGLAVLADPRAIRDPHRRTAIGSGAFNLVRREVFDRTPGFNHLRAETGDDVALGVMVKQAGGSVEMIDGREYMRVAIYRSIRELLRGIEKNGSTTAAVPFPLVVAVFAALGMLVTAPAAAIILGPDWLRALGVVALVAYTAGDCTAVWVNTRQWLPGLAWPLGGAIMAYGMLRSTWLAHRRGGVYWRGTFYPLGRLAEGRRFSILG